MADAGGLAAAIDRDPAESDTKLADQAVDFAFGPRGYQVRAIQAVEKAITDGRRDMLIAMATGTGKTKTAIGREYSARCHSHCRRWMSRPRSFDDAKPLYRPLEKQSGYLQPPTPTTPL